MGDEFEDDLNTPTEADLNECYGSKYLGGADVGDKKIRTKIAKVRKEKLRQQGGGVIPKFVLYFTTVDKPMVLNTTNKNVLVDALGGKPADWLNIDIGILVEPTQYQGKPTKGLRIRVLEPAKKQPPPRTAAPPKPTQSAAEPPPADDPDDPGAEPDSDWDFTEAAE